MCRFYRESCAPEKNFFYLGKVHFPTTNRIYDEIDFKIRNCVPEPEPSRMAMWNKQLDKFAFMEAPMLPQIFSFPSSNYSEQRANVSCIVAFIMWCWKFIFRVYCKFIEFDAIVPRAIVCGEIEKANIRNLWAIFLISAAAFMAFRKAVCHAFRWWDGFWMQTLIMLWSCMSTSGDPMRK